MPPSLKLIEGGSRRCPDCRREGMRGKRHKRHPHGPWCEGRRRPVRDRAHDLMIRTHDLTRGLAVEGRYEELIALLSPLEKQLPPRRSP